MNELVNSTHEIKKRRTRQRTNKSLRQTRNTVAESSIFPVRNNNNLCGCTVHTHIHSRVTIESILCYCMSVYIIDTHAVTHTRTHILDMLTLFFACKNAPI